MPLLPQFLLLVKTTVDQRHLYLLTYTLTVGLGPIHTSELNVICFHFTDRVDIESVGADEGDGIIQIIVLDPILEVLVGNGGQGQRSHRVLAAISQPHLQADGFTHSAVGNDIAVTRPPVHQHVWKQEGG